MVPQQALPPVLPAQLVTMLQPPDPLRALFVLLGEFFFIFPLHISYRICVSTCFLSFFFLFFFFCALLVNTQHQELAHAPHVLLVNIHLLLAHLLATIVKVVPTVPVRPPLRAPVAPLVNMEVLLPQHHAPVVLWAPIRSDKIATLPRFSIVIFNWSTYM
jgi:hypothetical protein